jgi:hypothetical protein
MITSRGAAAIQSKQSPSFCPPDGVDMTRTGVRLAFVAELSIEFCGVKAPNPFWLASAPPTNSEYQVKRAFDAGWGGAVWKTLSHAPIVNVSSR